MDGNRVLVAEHQETPSQETVRWKSLSLGWDFLRIMYSRERCKIPFVLLFGAIEFCRVSAVNIFIVNFVTIIINILIIAMKYEFH